MATHSGYDVPAILNQLIEISQVVSALGVSIVEISTEEPQAIKGSHVEPIVVLWAEGGSAELREHRRSGLECLHERVCIETPLHLSFLYLYGIETLIESSFLIVHDGDG